MAILAVLEGGLPACRKPLRTASLPTTTLHFPTPTQQAGKAVAHFQAAASRREEATPGGGRTKAGRTGGMVCDAGKERSNNFSDTWS